MASRAPLRESRPHRRSKARRRDDAVSVNAAYLKRFKQSASQCRSPRQFRELLDEVQTFVPYQRLVSLWGYPSSETIRYIFNHSFPVEFIRWYLTKGMLWKGPVFREWLRTNRPQTSVDVLRRLAKSVDPDIRTQARKFRVTNVMAGGLRTRQLWIYFVMSMRSEQQCRAYLSRFEAITPVLARALQRACPRPLLTKRETSILERRTVGKITKQIADAENISERTVREHLQSIKKKLYTDDLVNAVVIAIRSGMLIHAGKK